MVYAVLYKLTCKPISLVHKVIKNGQLRGTVQVEMRPRKISELLSRVARNAAQNPWLTSGRFGGLVLQWTTVQWHLHKYANTSVMEEPSEENPAYRSEVKLEPWPQWTWVCLRNKRQSLNSYNLLEMVSSSTSHNTYFDWGCPTFDTPL